MKTKSCILSVVLGAALFAAAADAASIPDPTGVPTPMVITALPSHAGSQPATLQSGDVQVLENNAPAQVVGMQRLAGNLAGMQLFILLDDSTRSQSLSIHLPALRTFLQSLPASTQVAVGYMQSGSFAMTQPFTSDHQKAANSFRLPLSIPGENGSPYFALSDLVQHWPSKEATGRRAVLMLTDGVDRYWGTSVMEDPYMNEAIKGALQKGVMVYSIYLRGSGLYGRSAWVTDFAQSRLIQLTEETGGYAYFEAFSDPVDIEPFLKDLANRLDNQYRITIQAFNRKGVQPVKLRTEMPGLKISGPTRIYVP